MTEKQVCCGMLRDPDTGKKGTKVHSLCGWSCMPKSTPSQPVKSAKEVLEAHLSYNHVDNMVLEDGRLWDAIISAMQEYASKKREWISVDNPPSSNTCTWYLGSPDGIHPYVDGCYQFYETGFIKHGEPDADRRVKFYKPVI